MKSLIIPIDHIAYRTARDMHERRRAAWGGGHNWTDLEPRVQSLRASSAKRYIIAATAEIVAATLHWAASMDRMPSAHLDAFITTVIDDGDVILK